MQPNIRVDESKRVLELERMKRSLELQLQEMARKIEIQQEMISMARRDPLTGLRSRAGVSDQINAILKASNTGTFFIMDMDNFKGVNDTYGHIEGDKVLVRFARALRRTAEPDDIVARLGGDEFIVFSPVSMNRYEVAAKARKIIKNIERNIVSEEMPMQLTISMGIAKAPLDGVTYEALYRNSDKALYYVKNNGKNGYKLFDEIIDESVKDAKERTRSSLSEITASIRKRDVEGSYFVEYGNFEKIYRFMERNAARENRDIQCVLFTIEDDISDCLTLQRHREHLQHAVTSSLRKGDVTTNYSSSQVLTLLIDVNEENAGRIVRRILDKYCKETGAEAMNISFEMERLKADRDTK